MKYSTDRGGKRRYTDEERAASLVALAANNGNEERTAIQLGIPRHTLRTWARGQRHPEAREMAEEGMGILADRFEEIAHKLLDHIPEKIQSASLTHVSVSLGICIDKMQLLRNRPTVIPGQELEGLSDDELARRLEETQARIAALDGGKGEEGPGAGEAPLPG